MADLVDSNHDEEDAAGRLFRPSESGFDDALPTVPELPPFFVPRARLHALKHQLIEENGESALPILLHGPAGSGKTSLVSAIARDADIQAAYPDGIFWTSLPQKGGLQLTQYSWGKAIENNLAFIPDTPSRIKTLRSYFKDRRALFIVDDLKTVEQALALRVGGKTCAYLFTTDTVENVSILKTRRYATNKMREEEALALIENWAGILPDIYVPTVREIVVRLCHLPLALAIIGGQARQGIMWLRLLELLKEAQGPLTLFDPDEEENVETMLSVVLNITLSRFGTPIIKRTSLLSVFAPGLANAFSVYAVAACWDTSRQDATETLSLLKESSLIQQVDSEHYAIHPSLHPHISALDNEDDHEGARQRVLTYYMNLLEDNTLRADIIDPQLGQILSQFFRTHEDNLPQTPTMAEALAARLEEKGLWSDYTTVLVAMAEYSRLTGAVSQEMACFSDLGYAFTMINDLEKAQRSYERSLVLSQRLKEPSGEANALNNLGALAERQQDFDKAEEYYRKSLRILQELGIRGEIASTLNNLAGVLYWKRLYDDALSIFERVQDMYNSMHDRRGQAQTWINIGAIYEVLGDDYEAQQAYYRSLAIYSNLKDEAGQALALNNLGIIFLHQDEHIRALEHFRRSLLLKRKINDVTGQAATLNNIALLYEKAGTYQQALNYYQQSYRILAVLEDPGAEVVARNINDVRKKVDEEEAGDQT